MARLEAEVGDEFHVLGLREHVEGDDAFEAVLLVFRENLEVPGERGRVAGDVEDLSRLLLAEEFEGGPGAATAWGVEDEGGVVGVEPGEYAGEEFLDAAEEELAVGAVAAFGVLAGCANCGLIHLDAGEGFHVLCHFEAEEADSAVGIHEVAAASFLESLADGIDESGEEVEVVLEE